MQTFACFLVATLSTTSAIVLPQQVSRTGLQPGTTNKSTASGLRAEIQNATQAIGVRGAAPRTVSNEPVFCDSLRLTLLLAHDGQSSAPIVISSIAVNASPLDGAQIAAGAACNVDRFSSQPHGIVEKETFFITVGDGSVKTRFMKDAASAVRVDDRNLLVSPTATRAITLKANEEPVGVDIIVHSLALRAQALTFTIAYDHNGARTFTTRRLLIWR
jgi:hypothetical protein